MGKAQEKIERMRLALSHREGDRAPAGEFFWTGFLKRCREKWGGEFDPYRHFDLDYVVITPNMDPRIQPFEIVKQEGENVWVKTGFGAVIRRSGEYPMPSYETFSIRQPFEMADFAFDDPADSRRFYAAGDDQINCVGDALLRNLPAWNERLKPYSDDFAVFGSVCEPFEYLWRIIGSENALIWMATAPDELAEFINRIGAFLLAFTDAQIKAGQEQLCGMYIWGDVAYHKGMIFGLRRWRELFKPHVKVMIELIHSHGLMAVYHGCGDSRALLGDLTELGLDAFNPVEAKAGMDAVELKKQYAGKLAFVGNIDIRALESNDPDIIRREILYKLQAARGGGWVFQSDHSVSSAVSPESYEYAVHLLREYGHYPLTI